MHEIGYIVLGSDKFESENVKRLKKRSISGIRSLLLPRFRSGVAAYAGMYPS
ncbi:MAG: hypothetical protein ACPGEF_07545 [Endozoicomonas sp.]